MLNSEVKKAHSEGNMDSSSEKGAMKQMDGDNIDSMQPFTEEEERSVKRKTDMVILPLMCAVFFLQYLDKQSLSYASVFGLITDLNLKGTEYSWCSSIFYIGSFSGIRLIKRKRD
jgi:hypothetical protein